MMGGIKMLRWANSCREESVRSMQIKGVNEPDWESRISMAPMRLGFYTSFVRPFWEIDDVNGPFPRVTL